ncbi:single-stranded-DNA-specific exonuclease RecJ, partial [bacterium]
MAETLPRRSPFNGTLVYQVGQRDPSAESDLTRELRISPLLAAALRARGYEDPESARAFLEPSFETLGDPELLPDFERAAEILLDAIRSKALIFVHGDYDADGVTSAALLSRFLAAVGANVHTFVPHRLREGYGVSTEAVETAKSMGVSVFLTCDCGVSAFQALELAMSYEMKVVVTDHHQPQASVPKVDALVNPHLPGSRYPFDELCGAAVAFRFCEGLARRLGMNVDKYRERFVEFAAIGTVADMMPLEGENRVIAAMGLRKLSRTTTPGLVRLKEHARTKPGTMSARDIGFGIGPRLNAVGRIDEPGIALQLLLTKDEDEAAHLAILVEQKNTERRAIQQEICDAALQIVAEQKLDEHLVLMVRGPKWHKGIVGLAASRVLERYGRPTFVLSYDPETGRYGGSARSIPGVDIFRMIEENRHLGVGGGGHAGAAGIHFHEQDFDRIFEAFERCAWEQVGPDGLPNVIGADFEADFAELTIPAIEDLTRMEPCGRGNEILTLLV